MIRESRIVNGLERSFNVTISKRLKDRLECIKRIERVEYGRIAEKALQSYAGKWERAHPAIDLDRYVEKIAAEREEKK